jgi:hypothetical protein
VFIVNENNTIFRIATTGACRTGSSNPPGLKNVPSVYLNWPDDPTLKSKWSTLD